MKESFLLPRSKYRLLNVDSRPVRGAAVIPAPVRSPARQRCASAQRGAAAADPGQAEDQRRGERERREGGVALRSSNTPIWSAISQSTSKTGSPQTLAKCDSVKLRLIHRKRWSRQESSLLFLPCLRRSHTTLQYSGAGTMDSSHWHEELLQNEAWYCNLKCNCNHMCSIVSLSSFCFSNVLHTSTHRLMLGPVSAGEVTPSPSKWNHVKNNNSD